MAVVKRLALGALVVGAAWFAVQGGEYGTSDLLAQRGRLRALQAEVDSLERQVDSLRKLARRLDADPVLQERVAREEFGMVRGDRELLFRLVEPRPEPARVDGGDGAEAARAGGAVASSTAPR